MWSRLSLSAALTSLTRRSGAGPRSSVEALPRTFVEPALARARSGISMKWSSASMGAVCSCGELSIRKATYSTCWFSRNKRAALKLLRKLLRKQGHSPGQLVTDGLPPYGAALDTFGGRSRHRPGRLRDNHRAENSHPSVRRREREMQRFNSQSQAQRLVAAPGAIYNLFNVHVPVSRSPLRTFPAAYVASA